MPQWVEIVLRSLGTLVVLYAFTRILGKKQISQLTFFEYILGITLGELAGFISTELESHFLLGLIAMCVWFAVPYGIEMLTLKSLKLRQLLEGKSRVLIKEGKLLEDNLKKERLTANELLEQLRGKSVFRVADVEFAMMETNGELSVLLKKDKQPLTAGDMGIQTVNEAEPQTVIIDGKIMDEGMANLGLSRGWLVTELQKIGVTLENVFLGQVDAYQQLYVDLYDDKIKVPYPQAKMLLMTSLKKIQADLELFATGTRNPEAKTMYANNAQQMETIISRLTPLLRQ